MDWYQRDTVRPRTPPPYNPPHTSLPIAINGNLPAEMHHQNIPVPRREIINNPVNNNLNASTVNTTYPLRTESPKRASIQGGRPRGSTLDSQNYPIHLLNTANQQQWPSIHPNNVRRPESMNRAMDSDYTTIPKPIWSETQQQIRPQQSNWGHDHVPNNHIAMRPRVQPQTTNFIRHPEGVGQEYGDEGFRYTNPQDLVQYDLEHSYHGPRTYTDGFRVEENIRPRSISAYEELVTAKTGHPRDHGPPPTSRGFDRIQVQAWDEPLKRIPPLPQVPSAPDPRLAREGKNRPLSVGPMDIPDRPRRLSHHNREPQLEPRDDLHDTRVSRRRDQSIHGRYDDTVEQRGFGIRPKIYERHDKNDKNDPTDQPLSKLKRDYRGRDVLAAGLSIASAALGITAVRNASRDEYRLREEEENQRRKESQQEIRRQRDLIDVESTDSRSSRDSKSRSRVKSNRHTKENSGKRDKNKNEPEICDSREQHPSHRRSGRTSSDEEIHNRRGRSRKDHDPEIRDHEPHLKHSRSRRLSSDEEYIHIGHGHSRKDKEPATNPGFNPRDTTDLKALQKALQNSSAPETRNTRREDSSASSKKSTDKDTNEIRIIVNERKPVKASDTQQPRVVSPPREKTEEKPVKGILRQPREKFPEDPVPMREGVAPLKDAKKNGIPPDARWTKISRRLVNPEALEIGKERYEARQDFVIVLRVLTREEVQRYADLTQKIRLSHEEEEKKAEASRLENFRARFDLNRRGRPGFENHQQNQSYGRPVADTPESDKDWMSDREVMRNERDRNNHHSDWDSGRQRGIHSVYPLN
ncbi:zinc finger protein DHHC domain containing protein [Golovinomyces cichoracearum]|uniref:Zinc finger protein DHHC domain containing protein n=1 Tax=Golovinomyces cichoracearum TaxID=62708 RepID=A0A420IAN1_9PEZI|nr:zinc finger protein DHHC domain containing protein [Golovinomyces cichoracearum]